MNIYILTAATLILIGGKISDIFNRKKLFLLGSGGFLFASVLLVIATNLNMMLLGRFFQGICAALIASGSLAILNITFKDRSLGFAIGVWTAFVGVGNAIGPFIGGMLTDFVSWRCIFVVNAVLITLTALIAVVCVEVEKESNIIRAKSKLDYGGFILFSVGIFLIIFGLSESSVLGLLHPIVYIAMILGVVILLLFLVYERKAESPLIHLSFLRQKSFVFANIGLFLIYFIEMGIPYFLNLFFQNSSLFGLSASRAGTMLLPFSIAIFIFSFLYI